MRTAIPSTPRTILDVTSRRHGRSGDYVARSAVLLDYFECAPFRFDGTIEDVLVSLK